MERERQSEESVVETTDPGGDKSLIDDAHVDNSGEQDDLEDTE